MEEKIRIQKDNAVIELQLNNSDKSILISAYEKSNEATLLFEEQFKFDHIKHQGHLICQSWETFSQSILYISQHQKDSITLNAQGVITIFYLVTVLGNKIEKQMNLPLKRRLDYQDEVKILREKVSTYQSQIQDLKTQVKQLKEETSSLSSRVNCLEQLVIRNKPAHEQLTRSQEKFIKNVEEESPLKEKLQINTEEASASSGSGEIIKLTFTLDKESLHYNKFIIDGNKITSLYEDYYQVHWKDPLPKKGLIKIAFKMTAKNHYSIGILGESQLKNQYSFQNNNSICLYTYTYGSFRGFYIRGKYYPLEWSINVNQIIEMEIDMTQGSLRISLKNQKFFHEIDIRQLQKSQNLYFFLEMYEKDNSLQFIEL